MHMDTINEFFEPYSGPLQNWASEKSTDEILFQYWQDDNKFCDYGYFTQFITLPNKDVLIGITPYDDDDEACRMDGVMDFIPLSRIRQIMVHKGYQD